jgi:hypothetical protein
MEYVRCDTHGLQQETWVCQHIAQGLFDRNRVGFFGPQKILTTLALTPGAPTAMNALKQPEAIGSVLRLSSWNRNAFVALATT